MVALRADREIVGKSWFCDTPFVSIASPEEIVWPLYTPCVEFAPDQLFKLAMDLCELIEPILIGLLNEKIAQKSNTYSRVCDY